MVSIFTPLKPFSPKSTMCVIGISFINDRVFPNSGALIKLLGTIKDTTSPNSNAFSMKKENILFVSVLTTCILYFFKIVLSLTFIYGGLPTTISYFLLKHSRRVSLLMKFNRTFSGNGMDCNICFSNFILSSFISITSI